VDVARFTSGTYVAKVRFECNGSPAGARVFTSVGNIVKTETRSGHYSSSTCYNRFVRLPLTHVDLDPRTASPMAQSVRKLVDDEVPDWFDATPEIVSNGAPSLSVLACVLAAERNKALETIDEQRRAILAMHERCGMYKAELDALKSVMAEIDDDSEARAEQLAALHVAVDNAEERARINAEHAQRFEAQVQVLLEEVERLRRASVPATRGC